MIKWQTLEDHTISLEILNYLSNGTRTGTSLILKPNPTVEHFTINYKHQTI